MSFSLYGKKRINMYYFAIAIFANQIPLLTILPAATPANPNRTALRERLR
jgi:hypothetical protein